MRDFVLLLLVQGGLHAAVLDLEQHGVPREQVAIRHSVNTSFFLVPLHELVQLLGARVAGHIAALLVQQIAWRLRYQTNQVLADVFE